MKSIRAIDLARALGLSRRTVSGWCANDPTLAFKRNGVYFIRIPELAKKPGFDLISALTLTNSKWVKAIDLAHFAGKPRRTLAHWCAHRPRFARRIGRIWYVDLEALGADEEQIETLRHFVPEKKTLIRVLESANFLRQTALDEQQGQ